MSRQVVFVLGTSYCGSTLLNHLLDAQPGVRGLSEAVHWFLPDSNAWCSRCRTPIASCRNWPHFANKDDFYEQVFGAYSDAHTLVNSSKHPGLAFRKMPSPPPSVACRAIVLSKTPHEFAWSFIGHRDGDVETAMSQWIEIHRWILTCLQAANTRPSWFLRSFRCPRITPRNVLMLSYRALALRPAEVIRRVCEMWGIPFDNTAAKRPWLVPSDTCMVGGNMALYSQKDSSNAFFADTTYLGGKYVGKRHAVFIDAQWRSDPSFCEQCRSYYTRGSIQQRLDGLAAKLGYPSGTKGFIADLAEKDRASDQSDRSSEPESPKLDPVSP